MHAVKMQICRSRMWKVPCADLSCASTKKNMWDAQMQGVKSKIWRCKLLTKREMCRCKVLVSKMWQCKMQVFSWFFVFLESAHITVQMRAELRLRRCHHLCGGWPRKGCFILTNEYAEQFYSYFFTLKNRYAEIEKPGFSHVFYTPNRLHAQRKCTHNFYVNTFVHTETFTHTHKTFHTQTPLQTEILQIEGFTHRNLYTQTLCTQTLVHKDVFTHRHLCKQKWWGQVQRHVVEHSDRHGEKGKETNRFTLLKRITGLKCVNSEIKSNVGNTA